MVVVVITISFYSCTNSEETENQVLSKKNELIIKGEEFAEIHNACVAYIFDDLSKIKTRTFSYEKDIKKLVISSANKYVAAHISTRSEIIDISQIYKLSIEEIRAQLSEKEIFYINTVLSMNRNSSFETILNNIATDSDISRSNRQALICFITTLKASDNYWDTHLAEWLKAFNIPQTRRWKDVTIADAWWGYQGMLSSGLNPWVGGGAAAVGSVVAALSD